jgi:hypothetical protein
MESMATEDGGAPGTSEAEKHKEIAQSTPEEPAQASGDHVSCFAF